MRKQLLNIAIAIAVSVTAAAAPMDSGKSYQEKIQTCKVIDRIADSTSGSISFNVEVPQSGAYILRMWQCPARLATGELQSYSIDVNGKRYQDEFFPATPSWSYLSSPTPVILPVGSTRITVNSALPSIPNVELVEIMAYNSVNKSKVTTPTKYDNYVAGIKRATAAKTPEIGDVPTFPKDTVTIYTDDPFKPKVPYDYFYRNISWFGYTFYTTAYFKEGQDITCSSTSKGSVSHFLEIFSSTAPQNHSWVKLSDDNGKAQLSITIPESGIYYVKVRPFKNGSMGLCDVNVNNIMTYEDVPMCTMGVKANYRITSDSYNIYTTNTESDPFMWVYSGGTYKGLVRRFNNDYESKGTIDWGKNARLSNLSSPIVDRVLISSASSFDPIGKCELYIGCKAYEGKNVSGGSFSFTENHFPMMKLDDTMISAPADTAYNCFAWAGGVHSMVVWPLYESSQYNTDQIVIGATALEALDNYYASERYPGCTRYVRTSSTIDNVTGGIDLWAKSSGAVPVHASINRNSDSNHHGYDWESKLGNNERIFHARHALTGNDYGLVRYHYEPVNDNAAKVSIEEAIANGMAVMDNPVLSESQERFISAGISAMSPADKDKFNMLYDKWQEAWNHSIVGNPEIIKENPAYAPLLEACKSNPTYMLFVYDKINKGVCSVIPLFEDIYFANNTQNRARIKRIHEVNKHTEYDEDGRKIVHTASSNLKSLLKQLIPDSSHKAPGIDSVLSHESPTDEVSQFDVTLSGNQIIVNMSLTRTTAVSIDVLDLDCNCVKRIKDASAMESGNYCFTSGSLEPNTYLVRCILNGCLNVKKVIIK